MAAKRKPRAEPDDPRRKAMEKEFAKACGNTDLASVQSLLQRHPDLAENAQAILNAAYAGAYGIVELLLDYGADANAVSKTAGHLRPLHRICEYKKTFPRQEGHTLAAEILVKRGADPTVRAGPLRLTPMAMAATGGYADLTQILAKKSPADIFHAAVLADEERVAALLEKDPSLATRPDINGMTALMYAVASRMSHVSRQYAVALTAITTTLLAAGADPNGALDTDHGPRTTLAFSIPNPHLTQILLKRGADPGPALIGALWNADYDTAALLLDYGANPKDTKIAQYVGGFAHWGHFAQARWLIEHGSTVDAVDKYNTTALQAAAKRGAKGDLIEFLVENGANPLVATDDGKTPYDLAKEKHKSQLLPILQAAMDRARLHAPGKDTSDDDAFEADLPAHMRSKRARP